MEGICTFLSKYEKEKTVIVFDTETTGKYPNDHVIELGAMELEKGCITGRSFHIYINPRKNSSPEAFKLHKIKNDFFKNYCQDYYLNTKKQLQYFLDFVGEKCVVGYNVKFDIDFMNKELKEWKIDGTSFKNSICLYKAITSYFEYKNIKMSKKLMDVCKYFGIGYDEGHFHTAMFDTLMTCKLYKRLYEVLINLQHQSIDTLSSNFNIFCINDDKKNKNEITNNTIKENSSSDEEEINTNKFLNKNKEKTNTIKFPNSNEKEMNLSKLPNENENSNIYGEKKSNTENQNIFNELNSIKNKIADKFYNIKNEITTSVNSIKDIKTQKKGPDEDEITVGHCNNLDALCYVADIFKNDKYIYGVCIYFNNKKYKIAGVNLDLISSKSFGSKILGIIAGIKGAMKLGAVNITVYHNLDNANEFAGLSGNWNVCKPSTRKLRDFISEVKRKVHIQLIKIECGYLHEARRIAEASVE